MLASTCRPWPNATLQGTINRRTALAILIRFLHREGDGICPGTPDDKSNCYDPKIMKEKTHTISAVGHSVYEVVENADEISLTIRATESPAERITIMRSMVSTLIDILRPLGSEGQSRQ
jgi:hypothetical protein